MSATATAPNAAPTAAGETLEVVLVFSSVEDYHAMGSKLATAREKLNLPSWATPTEVIAAALQDAL